MDLEAIEKVVAMVVGAAGLRLTNVFELDFRDSVT